LCRRCSGHYGAILNCRRRPGYVGLHVRRAQRAVLRGVETDGVGHMRASQRSFRDMASSAVNRLTAGESVVTRRGHRMHVMRVHIIEVVNVGIENIRVADEGIVDVDVSDVSATAVVPREKRFAKA